MENVFRTKKYRDTGSRLTKNEAVTGTLDSLHQSTVAQLRSIDVEELTAQKHTILNTLEHLELSADLSDILKVSKLHDDLKNIEIQINRTNAVEDYYTRNADIMLQYYGGSDKVQPVTSIGNLTDQNTFFRYLNPSASTDMNGVSKKELFQQYATRMKLTTTFVEERADTLEHCDKCNIAREELSAEGTLVCPGCGSEEYMMVVSDVPSFRDPPKERNNYAYKKINHLNEILNQFQAKESTIIPDEVMHEVVCEIKKRRIQNVAELNEKDMREILKKLNRSKYYEHATHILSRLNGNPPPTITPEIEEKIRTMFQEIQAPFLLYCPDDRTNFLSYSYILYKFFELLELDDYKVYFPLLKSRDRLIAHDEIWKKICDYLKWEFIQSV
jgi:flagellar biosynthesis/type III secretory pathway chaperone